MGTPTYVKPEFSDLEKCVAYAREFYRNAGGTGTAEEFSEVVGNSTTSSWFTIKLNAMRGYGLIDLDGNLLRITPLATRILRPSDESEEKEGLQSALQSFPIYATLVSRYQGKGEPGAQFVKNILEADGIKPMKSSEWANCFIASARYASFFDTGQPIRSKKEEKKDEKVDTRESKQDELPMLTDKEANEGWLVYPVPVAKGIARIIVPRDLPRSAWEKMQKLLNAIEPEKTDDLSKPS